MEIKFKDNPVTFKTVEVDGKKLTKQFLQQVPISAFDFLKIEDTDANSVFTYSYFYYNDSARFGGYMINGELIGWINARIDTVDRIIDLTESFHLGEIDNLIIILFINNSGELSRGYILQSVYYDMFGKIYPQIYI